MQQLSGSSFEGALVICVYHGAFICMVACRELVELILGCLGEYLEISAVSVSWRGPHVGFG